VDGTLIEAWLHSKSFRCKDADQWHAAWAQPRGGLGQERCNDTHASTTDADARLFK
jgi:hypothetical protein